MTMLFVGWGLGLVYAFVLFRWSNQYYREFPSGVNPGWYMFVPLLLLIFGMGAQLAAAEMICDAVKIPYTDSPVHRMRINGPSLFLWFVTLHVRVRRLQ